MKKLALTLSVFTAIFGSAAIANTTYQSPNMRGEITETITARAGTADLLQTIVQGLPAPNILITEIKNIPTVTITANTAGTVILDVTLIDEFLDDVAPNARHYPTNFPNRTAEYITTENVKHLSDWIEPYANAPDASFDVVIRAAQLNGMARNLNLGTTYTVRAGTYMQKALQLKPDDLEANLLFGIMLSESGGFKEGRKYLDKAVLMGNVEAEQSIAQADLLNDNRTAALKRLRTLANKHPNHAQIAEQIRIVDNGGYYIWNIKDNDIHVKPIK